MTLYFDNEYDLESLESVFDFDYLAVANTVVESVLEQEQCPYEAQVELLCTSDEAIRQMNKENRGIDRPTDVLSFPMVDFSEPCDYDMLEAECADFYFEPNSGELMLGNIVLSIPRIKAQAEEYGHSRKREYSFLIAHSVLHLLGYDHMTEEDEKEMEDKQNKVLDFLNITREVDA